MTSFPALHDSVCTKPCQTNVDNGERQVDFVKFSENEIQSLSEEQENTNTKKKTSYDVKLYLQNFSQVKNKKDKLKKFLPKNCKGWRLSLCLESERKMAKKVFAKCRPIPHFGKKGTSFLF